MASTVYVAVYLSQSPADLTALRRPTPELNAFVRAVHGGAWPYDAGDDPSFFCASRFQAPLSWGICRRNLRNSIGQGDTVVFIAHRKQPEGVTYHWAGFATVARKLSQADIWEDERHAVFRRYLNLLIWPDAGRGYVHHEAHPGQAHPDWLWRLTESKGHGWQARDFSTYLDPSGAMSFVRGRDYAANGEPIELAANYVVFSTNAADTLVLVDPPVVAEYRSEWGPQTPERWVNSPLAQGLRSVTLGLAARPRTLRLTTPDPTRTRMQPRHPHVKIATGTAARWRENARRLLRDAGATMR